ncbi:MAG TPA: response regulator transcription factor [Aggregatilineales bacterium]|nr:response regulator transcription factor [Aggregatilineales bacterium]
MNIDTANNNMGVPHKIHVAIVDDHPLVRAGLRGLLEAQPDFAVLAEAETGQEALALARDVQPDVMLLDIHLPDFSGLQVTARIKAEFQKILIVLLTAYDDDETVLQGMRAGASAYCSKDMQSGFLIDAIRQVNQGCYIIRGKAFDQAGIQRWLDNAVDARRRLSRREMVVLRYVIRGLRDKQIGSELGISLQTVKNHVASILKKLDVGNRTEAAVYALERGWIAPFPRSRTSQNLNVSNGAITRNSFEM